MFAYAHDEVGKLSGQLLMDVANRLPGVLKRRYLDYLSQHGFDLNCPGFDSLHKFAAHELHLMSSDYAQTFFKSDDKPRDSTFGRGPVKVRSVNIKSDSGASGTTPTTREPSTSSSRGPARSRQYPLCFVCNDVTSRHYLGDCIKLKSLNNEEKRRAVTTANWCFNCLAIGHAAVNCSKGMRCRICAPTFWKKHAGVLHQVFTSSNSVNLGATEQRWENALSDGEACDSNDCNQRAVRKLAPAGDSVLLHTCAVCVVNASTGKSTLAYAQHDIAGNSHFGRADE